MMGRKVARLAAITVAAMGISAGTWAQTWTVGSLTATFTAEDSTLTISETGAIPNYSTTSQTPPPDPVLWTCYYSTAPWAAKTSCNSNYVIRKLVIEEGVTSIGTKAFFGMVLRSVAIGDGVTSIGDSAFAGNSSLTSVTIGNGVTSIGRGAFNGCSDLTSVTIGDGLIALTNLPLDGYRLTSITVGAGNATYSSEDGVLFNKNKTTLIKYLRGKQGTEYTIPNSVTAVDSGAFSGVTGLMSLTIGNGLTALTNLPLNNDTLTSINVSSGNTRYSAVDGVLFSKAQDTLWCYPRGKQGTEYTIPDGVTSIGGGAFSGRRGLTSVTIPNSVTAILNNAFSRCTGLTSVTIPNSVTSIGNQAFDNCTGLTSVTIPDGVTSIGRSAFSDCSGLTSVTIPTSVTSIGEYAFQYCTGLTSLTINGNTSIGYYAFRYCSGLTSLTINGNASIGDAAFGNVTGLTSLTIGDGLTSINYLPIDRESLTSITVTAGNTAYSSEDGVLFNKNKTTLIKYPRGKQGTEYTIPNSVTTVGEGAFQNVDSLTSLTIGDGLTSINYLPISGANLTSITVTAGNTAYSSADGILFSKFKNTLVRYPAAKAGAYTVPTSVTTIQGGAFRNSTGLTSVTIGDNTDSLGVSAFFGCTGLTSVSIGNSIASLAAFDFPTYTALTSIAVGESNAKFSSVDGVLFNRAQDTLLQYPRGRQGAYTIADDVVFIGTSFGGSRGLTSVVIGEGVTSIEAGAFSNCVILTSVKIGPNVAAVGSQAFGGCAALTSVVSLRVSPPTANAAAFSGVAVSSAYLYVPETSGDVYAAAAVWKDFRVYPNSDVITVEFNSQGGSAVGFQLVVDGVRVTEPVAPVRAGYDFGGWYREAACTTPWDFEADVVSSGMTLYAAWGTASYAVQFIAADENGTVAATVDGAAIASGALVGHGKGVVFTASPAAGYGVSAWTLNGALVSGNTTTSYTVASVSAPVLVTVSFAQTNSVAELERVVPQSPQPEEAAVIAPVVVLSGEFTAGPNPVSKSSGSVNFYRQGRRIANCELRIYDATGNVINRIKISDKALNSQARRKVGSWDLTDRKGRLVSDGTYLVKGVIKTSDGNSEKVSVILGVR